jgi:hypothetical protein
MAAWARRGGRVHDAIQLDEAPARLHVAMVAGFLQGQNGRKAGVAAFHAIHHSSSVRCLDACAIAACNAGHLARSFCASHKSAAAMGNRADTAARRNACLCRAVVGFPLGGGTDVRYKVSAGMKR